MGRRSDPRWREQAALELLVERLLTRLPAGVTGPLLLVDEPAAGIARPLPLAVERWGREATPEGPGSMQPPEGRFGVIAVRMSRSRAALRYALGQAAARARPGALLLVYGANDEGVGSAGRELEEVGTTEVVSWASGKRCRVLGGRLPHPPDPIDPADTEIRHPLELPGLPARSWVAYPGVFAQDRLDPGTRLLLASLPPLPAGARVLDWGAGTGEIALFLRERDGAEVTLLERDALAATAARRNVPEGRVVEGDGWRALPPGSRFTHLVANPPYHLGKAESIEPILDFLAGGPEYLEPGAELHFVVQRRLPVQPAAEALYEQVEVVVDQGPYRVWRMFTKMEN